MRKVDPINALFSPSAYKYSLFAIHQSHPSYHKLNQRTKEELVRVKDRENMKAAHCLAVIALLALSSSPAFASDPSPLQDFCVAINDTNNGGTYIC